jgi:hypothetical protein
VSFMSIVAQESLIVSLTVATIVRPLSGILLSNRTNLRSQKIPNEVIVAVP